MLGSHNTTPRTYAAFPSRPTRVTCIDPEYDVWELRAGLTDIQPIHFANELGIPKPGARSQPAVRTGSNIVVSRRPAINDGAEMYGDSGTSSPESDKGRARPYATVGIVSKVGEPRSRLESSPATLAEPMPGNAVSGLSRPCIKDTTSAEVKSGPLAREKLAKSILQPARVTARIALGEGLLESDRTQASRDLFDGPGATQPLPVKRVKSDSVRTSPISPRAKESPQSLPQQGTQRRVSNEQYPAGVRLQPSSSRVLLSGRSDLKPEVRAIQSQIGQSTSQIPQGLGTPSPNAISNASSSASSARKPSAASNEEEDLLQQILSGL